MNGGESEKKGEEGFEICEIGENILPQNRKFSGFKAPDEEKTITIIKKKEQSTNSEVKTDPAVDSKLAIKHDLAGLSSKVMEAPLS